MSQMAPASVSAQAHFASSAGPSGIAFAGPSGIASPGPGHGSINGNYNGYEGFGSTSSSPQQPCFCTSIVLILPLFFIHCRGLWTRGCFRPCNREGQSRSGDDQKYRQFQPSSRCGHGRTLWYVRFFRSADKGPKHNSKFSCRHTRGISDEKQKHAFAFELGKRLVKEEREWSRYLDDHMGSPIVEAMKKGIIELKDWNIYNLLKRKIELGDGMLVGDVDNNGNTILHLAAKLGTPSFRSVQRGHLYQMMWDVCWFEHVSHDSPPHLMYLQNSDGEMATDAFLREHSEIRSEAEKSVKDVNNGLMLVVVLIGTVNYAALFTPPGGYRQDEKYPKYGLPVIFTEEMRIYFLLIYCGLFTGVLSFTIMFSIQSLPFRSSDFYLDLPLRLFLAMSSLVLSMAFTALSSRQVYGQSGLPGMRLSLVTSIRM
ncbi:hypothetical protein RHGRI_016195 [Rhododendron griersonianum]|uniref:PGG domain-containing protein n=1 Tax=Rhododendron griersonianum TaxID=479676 RepID=A0AAV6JTA6_9ERIC|nr:hypothetical protein RHGRI_016195 [Rhododendron griersonianum]